MRLIVFLFCALLPFTAMAQENPITARMNSLAQAYNAQDLATIGEFYAPNAILLPPGSKAVIGRDKIRAHYQAAFAAGAANLQFKTFDIHPLNADAAVEIGETLVEVGGQRIVGRYMHLWEVIDGQVLLTRDIYHVLKVE